MSFLALPVEVRLIIYDFVFPQSSFPPITAHPVEFNRRYNLALLRTCKLFNNEAHGIVYSRIIFPIRHLGGEHCRGWRCTRHPRCSPLSIAMSLRIGVDLKYNIHLSQLTRHSVRRISVCAKVFVALFSFDTDLYRLHEAPESAGLFPNVVEISISELDTQVMPLLSRVVLDSIVCLRKLQRIALPAHEKMQSYYYADGIFDTWSSFARHVQAEVTFSQMILRNEILECLGFRTGEDGLERWRRNTQLGGRDLGWFDQIRKISSPKSMIIYIYYSDFVHDGELPPVYERQHHMAKLREISIYCGESVEFQNLIDSKILNL